MKRGGATDWWPLGLGGYEHGEGGGGPPRECKLSYLELFVNQILQLLFPLKTHHLTEAYRNSFCS